MRDAWSDVEVIEWCQPACPHCRSPLNDRVRTEANGDGSVTRRLVCLGCYSRWKAVELPAGSLPPGGSVELDIGIMHASGNLKGEKP